MRAALLTNTSVGGASAASNPSAAAVAASQASASSSSTAVVQAAAQNRNTVLASERGVAPDKRTEENFDSRPGKEGQSGAALTAQRDQEGNQRRLLAVA